MPVRFIFAACQSGAERVLKDDVARSQPQWRPAFARPGFVTFRLPDERTENAPLTSAFARASGYSYGKATGANAAAVARDAWRVVRAELPDDTLIYVKALHVWQRVPSLPGDEGFEPGSSSPTDEASAALLELRPELGDSWSLAVNQVATPGDFVLDCALVEPLEWWLGWHRATTIETCWPGGIPPLSAPERLISRAYLKIQEALLWSQVPIAAGDRCIEIGSAPGGSCLALLERGCTVIGIDPAEMDPRVLAQPGFSHLRAKAKEVKRSVFRDCRWLLMDANVAPKYTLDTVGAIVAHSGVRPEGLLLTLKLTAPSLAAKLGSFERRIRQWGYRRVAMRQLAFNRQEICVVATEPKD